MTTMSFKVHTDQKATIDAAIEKAKSQSGTAAGTVALEFICLDFMGGASLAERLKKAGPEAAFKAIEAAFPSYNVEVTMPEEEAAAHSAPCPTMARMNCRGLSGLRHFFAANCTFIWT